MKPEQDHALRNASSSAPECEGGNELQAKTQGVAKERQIKDVSAAESRALIVFNWTRMHPMAYFRGLSLYMAGKHHGPWCHVCQSQYRYPLNWKGYAKEHR